VTLLAEGETPRTFSTAWKIVRACRRHRARFVFLCHYERRYIFIAAWLLRLTGRRVFTMVDSKYDDYQRHLWREVAKSFMMRPYRGALTASSRGADYLRFLRVNARRIRLGYDAISLERIRAAAGGPGDTAFEDRYFLVVARLVPKKNHRLVLDAYARYASATERPRRLTLCGSGPLEEAIRAQIQSLGIEALVDVLGNIGPTELPAKLGGALCLLLPSLEEQFGIAVVEAQAVGLPVIVSTAVGARDLHVRTGVNGFVVEPDNEEGLAWCMARIGDDEELWRRFSAAALEAAPRSDASAFVAGAIALIEDRDVSAPATDPR
jgi:glycosyltransferase involved in cell wall biosynthesis